MRVSLCEWHREAYPKRQSPIANRRQQSPIAAIQGAEDAAPVQRDTVRKSRNHKAEFRLRQNGVRVRSQPGPSTQREQTLPSFHFAITIRATGAIDGALQDATRPQDAGIECRD